MEEIDNKMLHTLLNTFNEVVERLNDVERGLAGVRSDHNEQFRIVTHQFEVLNSRVGKIESSIGTIEERVGSIESTHAHLAAKVDNIGSAHASLAAKIEEVQLRQKSLAIQQDVPAHHQRLDPRDYRRQVSPYSLTATHKDDAIDLPFYVK